MAYDIGAVSFPVLHVPITRNFVNSWNRGRMSHDAQSMAEYFTGRFGLGYLATKKESGLYVLRFDEKNLAVPLRANGHLTAWEMEANGFYHERQAFQLGQKSMKPARMDGNAIMPGIVKIDWKTMYG